MFAAKSWQQETNIVRVAAPRFRIAVDWRFGYMKLGFEEEQTPYTSASQSARFWTEAWVRSQVFCPNCGNLSLDQYENNRPVADFHCASCREEYELKAQKTKFGSRVLDGAFRTMCERLAASNNPNLMLMNYDLKSLSVKNLCVVPKHFSFVRSFRSENRFPSPRVAPGGSAAIFF